MYVNILKAPLGLREEKLDIVLVIQQLLKSSKSLKKMAGEDPMVRPTIKLVCEKVKQEGEESLKGVVLTNYNPKTLKVCATQALADINQLKKVMRLQMEWSNLKMLRTIFVFLRALQLGVNSVKQKRTMTWLR